MWKVDQKILRMNAIGFLGDLEGYYSKIELRQLKYRDFFYGFRRSIVESSIIDKKSNSFTRLPTFDFVDTTGIFEVKQKNNFCGLLWEKCIKSFIKARKSDDRLVI